MNLIDIYNFFFNYQIESSFAAFLRVITCGYVTAFIGWSIKDVLFFSHPNKIFSGENYIRFCKEKYPQISLFNIFPNSIVAYKIIVFCCFLFGIFSTLGFITNLSVLLFTIFFISLQSRILPIIFTGGDVVVRVLLVALFFIDCGSRYSLDYLLNISTDQQAVNGFGARLVQLTIVFGYFLSGFAKLKDNFWVSGEAFKNAMHSVLWSRRICLDLFKRKFIYLPLNYSVLFFEFFAPILFALKETRVFAIFFGILLHLGIIIFMRIGFFGPIMLIALMYFCNSFFK